MSKREYNFNNQSFLIVDDLPINNMLLKEFFKDCNADIHCAANGGEALQIFAANLHIKIILLDIGMPGMDGYQALAAIRQLSETVKVIAHTASIYTRRHFIESGFNDYISKPTYDHQLLDLFEYHLNN